MEYNTLEEFLKIFDGYQKQYITDFPNQCTDKNNIFPKRLTMLYSKHCDYCLRNDCVNKNGGSNTVSLIYLSGIQLCDKCLENKSHNYFKYIMEINYDCITIEHFEKIIKLLKPDIDIEKLWIKRTSGVLEEWKLDDSNLIYINRSTIYNVPIISLDNQIAKTIKLQDLCKLNDINYGDCVSVIKTIYKCNE